METSLIRKGRTWLVQNFSSFAQTMDMKLGSQGTSTVKIPLLVHTTKMHKVRPLTNIKLKLNLKVVVWIDFKATLFPFWIPPISGVKKACFGCRSLCFQGHLYSTTLTEQPSEHWHFWILSTLAPRKSLDGEIKKPFGMSFSLWWVWLATR